MHDSPSPTNIKTSRQKQRRDAIDAFLNEFAPSENHGLLAEMMVTLTRLAADGSGRGELKILNTALKELRYGFKIFEPYRHIRKVSIFGSSRTPEDHPEYAQAVQFASFMRDHQWMVITGAGNGIMRAGHGGAGKEASFGVAIRLPFEQEVNRIIADDRKLVNFKYFFTRKLIFIKECDAIALFPGGFGTQDEGFEALTLIQTGKADMVPVVLIDAPNGTYWQHWRTYVQAELLRTNMISPEDMHLFSVTDSVEKAADIITRFYRRYHSMRYVRDELVLRLSEPLSDEALTRIADEFGDIINGGRYVQQAGPLADEGGEFPEKTRLIFPFNKRSLGRLRQLIDRINAE